MFILLLKYSLNKVMRLSNFLSKNFHETFTLKIIVYGGKRNATKSKVRWFGFHGNQN